MKLSRERLAKRRLAQWAPPRLLTAAAVGAFATVAVTLGACSSDVAAVPEPPDADVPDVVLPKRDVTPTPIGPASPTPRCTTARPPSPMYIPPAWDAGALPPAFDGGDASGHDAGDGSSGDAASDGAVPSDASDEAGGRPLTPSPARPPAMDYAGGPVLANPTWIPIFYKDTDDQVDIADFMGSVGCTDYWHTIADEYGVGGGLSADPIVLDENAPKKIDDGDIQKFLRKQIDLGVLPAPKTGTLYVLFFPGGTVVTENGSRSCYSFGGYHYETTTSNDVPFPYAVIPRCGGLDTVTSTTTHELIEAATDPFVFSAPAWQGPADRDIAWAYSAGGENSDMCVPRKDADYTPPDYPYAVQRNFSSRSAAAGHDPCIPQAGPYVVAAPWAEDDVRAKTFGGGTAKGIYVPAGSSRVVDVVLASDDPSVGAFRVEVKTGNDLNLPDSDSTFTLDRGVGAPGEHLRLSITASTSARPASPDVFALVSRTQGRERYYFALVGH